MERRTTAHPNRWAPAAWADALEPRSIGSSARATRGWGDGIATYPDGSRWFAAALFTLRDGKVHRETWFFGPPLDAPAWRAQWVERID